MSDTPEDSNSTDARNKRKREESSSDSSVPNWLTGSSPPRFVSLEELMRTASGLDNMTLAHEIAVNTDFRLEKPSTSADAEITTETDGNSRVVNLQKTVHNIVHQAFWDSLEASLNANPPSCKHALILLAEIKQSLLSLLLPHHTKLKAEIDEHLDLELFEQQCDKSTLDFMPIAQYVLNVMSKLCAPIRDEAVKALKEKTGIVEIFRGAFDLLDLMKLDMANFTIASMRPMIQQQSVEYERSKFDDYLKINPGGLQATTDWLRRSVENWEFNHREDESLPKIQSTEGASSSCRRKPPDFESILLDAYFALLEWDDQYAFPETFVVDHARLMDMKNKCLQLIITSSAILVATNLGGKDLADYSSFKSDLKDKCLIIMENCNTKNLASHLKSAAEQVVAELETALNVLNLPKWDNLKIDTLKGQLNDLINVNNPVRKVIRDRVKQFVSNAIGTKSASPIKVPPGLNAIQKELARLTGSFLRLISHNRSVFCVYYERIFNDFLLPILDKGDETISTNQKVASAEG